MGCKNISELMDIWATFQQTTDSYLAQDPPFARAQDLYDKINSTEIGNVLWQVSYLDHHDMINHNYNEVAWQAFSVQ
jgi:hypothetical protein